MWWEVCLDDNLVCFDNIDKIIVEVDLNINCIEMQTKMCVERGVDALFDKLHKLMMSWDDNARWVENYCYVW